MRSLIILTLLLSLAVVLALGQTKKMNDKQYNFYEFDIQKKIITGELKNLTAIEYHNHPEFGIRPYRTQCVNCIELIDRREMDSRYFIEPGSGGSYFYVQQSYSPLHFKDKAGWLRTLDHRLLPDPINPGVYSAASQPVPAKLDLNNEVTSITSLGFEYSFNNNLKMYYLDESMVRHNSSTANFTKTTVGYDGALSIDAWEHVDIEQIFKPGKIKTNFIIKKPLHFPSNDGWLVFEDKVNIPDAYIFELHTGHNTNDGFWQGALVLKDDKDRSVIRYELPKYYDLIGYRIKGQYNLIEIEGGYVIQVLVPIEWLQLSSTRYPVKIDPLVTGFDSVGAYQSVPFDRGAKMAFTEQSLGSCDYNMVVDVPGKSELFNVFISLERRNSDSLCVPPPDTIPFCSRFDAEQVLVSDCNSATLIATPSPPPFIGTSTTDPNKVGGTGSISLPGFLSCIPPQCDTHHVNFELRNISLQCSEVCNYKCAIGTHWALTVSARTIENTVTADQDPVCIGEETHLTAFPEYGVPPYTYVWTPGGSTDSIATVYPSDTTTYVGTAFDICGNSASDDVTVSIKPTPNADAGSNLDLCEGASGIESIGGSPTGPSGSTYEWTAIPSSAINYISDPNIANPLFSAQAGLLGEYNYVVRVEDSRCFQYDTVRVAIFENPEPLIESDTTAVICDGDEFRISTVETYSNYDWSTGETGSSIDVTESGTYSVTITDANGCTGTATSTQIKFLPTLSFNAFPDPDTAIELGNSATLSASINLLGSDVDEFNWFPAVALSCTDCPNPQASPEDDQLYYLSVVSSDGCESLDSVLIKIILPDEYVIPNAFSPNQDGVNDRFYIIKASGVTVKEFKVFNRWGEIVHSGAEPWDGTYKDEVASMGTYTYYMSLYLFDGRDVLEKGTVTLIR